MGKTLEILPDSRNTCLAGKTVSVHITPEAELFLYHGNKRLAHRVIQPRATTKVLQKSKAVAHPTPPPDPAYLARRRAWLHGKHKQNDGAIMSKV